MTTALTEEEQNFMNNFSMEDLNTYKSNKFMEEVIEIEKAIEIIKLRVTGEIKLEEEEEFYNITSIKGGKIYRTVKPEKYIVFDKGCIKLTDMEKCIFSLKTQSYYIQTIENKEKIQQAEKYLKLEEKLKISRGELFVANASLS